jgi:hypothetical protein
MRVKATLLRSSVSLLVWANLPPSWANLPLCLRCRKSCYLRKTSGAQLRQLQVR